MKTLGLTVVAGLVAVLGWGATLTPLSTSEQAAYGATHVAAITYKDLTNTAIDTAQTLTALCPVASNHSVSVVAMVLKTAFETATAWTNSLLLEVGDGDDTDRFLASTELASDTGPTWFKLGRNLVNDAVTALAYTNLSHTAQRVTLDYAGTNAPTVTVTLAGAQMWAGNDPVTNAAGVQSVLITNVTVTATVTANSVAAMTNATLTAQTATVTGNNGSIGKKTYTSDDYVDFKFTPMALEAVHSNTVGEVWVYLNILPH